MSPSNSVLSHHISSQFNEDLQDVHTKFMTMGGLVEQQVANAIHALLDTDANLAIDVQFKDNTVNQLERDIDEGLTLILARRHPAAIDLRMVIAMSKANTDLERIGDEAAKIANNAMAAEAEYSTDDAAESSQSSSDRKISGLERKKTVEEDRKDRALQAREEQQEAERKNLEKRR